MKHLRCNLICLLLLFLNLSCTGQSNKTDTKVSIQETAPEINDEERIELARKELPISIDSINNLYLVDGDPPYPLFSIDNTKINATITVSYKAKNEHEKMYWDVYNENGYFAQYKDVNDPQLLSNEIRDHLMERGLDNYTITAIVIYDDVIKTVYGEEDLDYYPNKNLYQFVFEDGEWKFDKLISTSEI